MTTGGHEHAQDGTSPAQKLKVALEFQRWIKVGFVTFINAAVEGSFQKSAARARPIRRERRDC